MKFIHLICVSLFLTSLNLPAFHEQGKPASLPKKELVKSNSKSSFLHKVKKEKKVSIDEGEPEITTYQSLISIIKANDLNRLKKLISDNNNLILLSNERGENTVYYLSSNNNVKALEIVLSNVKPDLALQAINTRNTSEMSALHIAAQHGAHDAAILMLSKGAAVDMPGPANISAYVMALNKQDSVMACILAGFGALVRVTPIGEEQQLVKTIKYLSSEYKEFLLLITSNGECKIGANFMKTSEGYVAGLTRAIVDFNQDLTLARNLKEFQTTSDCNDSETLVEECLNSVINGTPLAKQD